MSDTARIVHIASGREWRGGQKQAWLLARELRDLDCPQIVVTGVGTELERRLRAEQIEVHAVGWQAGLSPAAARAAWVESRRGGAILHAHDGHSTTIAGMAATLSRVPYIATRRVDFPLRRLGFWGRADRVVAISDAVRNIVVRDGLEPGRVPVIHSGIDVVSVAATSPDGARAALGLPLDQPLAVATGALVDHKDHRTLVAAAAHARKSCPELIWAVAGEGPLRNELEAQIAHLDLVGTVRLLGHLSDPLPLVAAADCFVTSSKEEGLGTAMLDAMALGRPVAATAGGGIPEILTGESGLVVPVRDHEALGDAVVRVVTDPALAGTLGERALARVAHFSARRMAEAYLALYRSLMPTPTGR
ncbi:MAG: glycosyltransferase [Gemmatimonadota bacterium]